ncbi:bifunctional phosphopantothenoylcysteine decarboxylase/phosphopantothenate--cysteine ligase CoaBC [Roseinatronobacter sp. S2]|uniref:bifunctional phosphopantothenoylcysteine decarboxylase/phosphopantothenate--cysteine ligase CoaBC n=1 Tax=Roseinatronobacter sp. S2 TaxID=3035471 RepID=UPI002410236F|nr:bifunctional phosphopantothenoylcysteine decarboxylase/phosphopantothenate--cysteine ligase CoaBC [Roseinatronobacter sp. S2]WFE73615.1 bifunctional phosphopantothenoylcysteine decarboxylase/phosphopantothenate--cysteine ligase CoaBC [Roseinatronobacter sp. S2]
MVAGKHITLIIGGGIAAYKCLDLIRKLRAAGAQVTPVVTRAGAEFVTPLSVAALAGARVYQDLFDLKDESEMGHIQLSRAADLLVVAPATADMMAKMAGGHADDLATTLLLATDKPVLIAPAMNLRMWEHAATRRNLAQLRADGVAVVGSESGDMACGEYGPGRMAEPAQILDAIATALGPRPLTGKRVLVTSGPTHEPIDPVRYIANRSSGAQGTAIAAALRDLGADVVFVTGPAPVAPPSGVQVVAVETARDMLHAVDAALPVDVAVMAAAVADWRVENNFAQKIKKTPQGTPELRFSENPDILKQLSSHASRPELVIGFAAETENVVANAMAKRTRKGCDWIVANDVSPATGIMGGSENAVHLVTQTGVEDWPRLPKTEVARKLAARIAKALT